MNVIRGDHVALSQDCSAWSRRKEEEEEEAVSERESTHPVLM